MHKFEGEDTKDSIIQLTARHVNIQSRAKCRGKNDHNKEIQRAERNVGKAVVHTGIAFLIILLDFAVPFCICEGTTVESTSSKLANTILARMHAYAHNIGARTRRTE